jgi:hypothetical protein
VGVVTFGRACLRVLGDCQKQASRPRAVVKTIWERFFRRAGLRDERPLEERGRRRTLS